MRIPHALSFLFVRNPLAQKGGTIFLQQNRQHPFSEDAQGETGLSFRFSLTYEEAREAFLLIIDRRSPAVRRLMGSLLLGLGALCALLTVSTLTACIMHCWGFCSRSSPFWYSPARL